MPLLLILPYANQCHCYSWAGYIFWYIWELEAKSLSFWTMIYASWSFNVAQQQLDHTLWKRKESLWPLAAYSMNQRLRSTWQGFLPISILDCSFTFLCLALSIPCLHFQGNHCSKVTTLGTSQACTVQVPVWVHVGCGVLSTFAGFTVAQFIGKGRETLTLHCLKLALYIYLNLSEGQDAGHRECAICHVQALGSQLLYPKAWFEKRIEYNTLSWWR